jgi:hypothetical protein
MPNEQPSPTDRSTTRRDLLIGSTAILTVAAGAAAAPPATTVTTGSDKPTIQYPRVKVGGSEPVIVCRGFVASGTVPRTTAGTVPYPVVSVTGFLAKRGSTDPVWLANRGWLRTHSDPYRWGVQFLNVPPGDYDLIVYGVNSKNGQTEPAKLWVRVVECKKAEKPTPDGTKPPTAFGPKLHYPEFPTANGEEIPAYFVPYGTYAAANHYIIQATMVDDLNQTFYPIAIACQPTDFVIEFDLPADTSRVYTLTIIDAQYHVTSFTGLHVV